MNLKKKVIFGMVAGFFAVATMFNMSMLNNNGAGEVSLDAIAVMAEAQGEHANICSAIWKVTYSGSVGTSTGVTVTCSTGGTYKCPICFW